MSEYKHGAYASIVPTEDFIAPKAASTLPVYIGRAPVNQLPDEGKGTVGKPILITSFNDAVKKIGYAEDWKSFELCEAVYAHFKNSIQSVGPIVVINVLDAVENLSDIESTAAVTISKGKGEILTSKGILSTVSIEGKTLGTDFSVSYSADGTKIIITDLVGSLNGTTSVKYFEVDADSVTKEQVIAGIEQGVPMVYQTYNRVPTILCAPGWSKDTDIHGSLMTAADKIGGHWYAFVNSDLPADSTVNTIDKAIAEKQSHSYGGAVASVCYPMAKKDDRIFHLSVLATYTMQRVDMQNDDLPFESPSNKPVDITGLCLEDGTSIEFDQTEANRLNAAGIRTVSFWGGKQVLWGSHTSLFTFGETIDPKDQFDCSVRMLRYIANDFQLRYGDIVDKPMKRALVDTILNDYQERLDGWKQQGALLGADIHFEEASNGLSDVASGDFIFDIATTTTMPAKSITAKIIYTAGGLSVLFGGEE